MILRQGPVGVYFHSTPSGRVNKRTLYNKMVVPSPNQMKVNQKPIEEYSSQNGHFSSFPIKSIFNKSFNGRRRVKKKSMEAVQWFWGSYVSRALVSSMTWTTCAGAIFPRIYTSARVLCCDIGGGTKTTHPAKERLNMTRAPPIFLLISNKSSTPSAYLGSSPNWFIIRAPGTYSSTWKK